MGRLLGVEHYGEAEKSQALAVLLSTNTLEDARGLLIELWEKDVPALSTLHRWKLDTSIIADMATANRIDLIHRGEIMAKLQIVWGMIFKKFEDELDVMSWKDMRDAMVAMGITVDKIKPPEGGGVQFTVNDMRGDRTFVAVMPRKTDDGTLIEGHVEEVTDGDEPSPTGQQTDLLVASKAVGVDGADGAVPSE